MLPEVVVEVPVQQRPVHVEQHMGDRIALQSFLDLGYRWMHFRTCLQWG